MKKMDVRNRVRRAVWMEVNLDAITKNVTVLRKLSKNPNVGVIAVVKANGMGLGAVAISRHLKDIGVERLAVATIEEGRELREARIDGPIHLLGNVQHYEMVDCVKCGLVPTVVDTEAVLEMAKALKSTTCQYNIDCQVTGKVTIKVDTGMSRNGCQSVDLPRLVTTCEEHGVSIDGIFTHLACWDVPDFNQKQLEIFYEAIKPYRNSCMVFHASNSGGSMTGAGSDLDFIRPGVVLFGAPPSNDKEIMEELGFAPTVAVRGTPTLVKLLRAGCKIGYDATHECKTDSWIATFPIGYADGLWRAQSNGKGQVIRDKTGEKCLIVGRVSMDAVTVEVPEEVGKDETFTFLSADFDPITSVVPFSETVDSIPHDVLTKFTKRLPRIYFAKGKEPVVTQLTSTF